MPSLRDSELSSDAPGSLSTGFAGERVRERSGLRQCLTFLIGLLLIGNPLSGAELSDAEPMNAEPIVVKRNGGWCWFQAERAVVVSGKVVLTSIAGDDHGGFSAGDLVATAFDPITQEIEHSMLHAAFQRDDHDVAGLCLLPDRRLLAVYGKHGSDHQQQLADHDETSRH